MPFAARRARGAAALSLLVWACGPRVLALESEGDAFLVGIFDEAARLKEVALKRNGTATTLDEGQTVVSWPISRGDFVRADGTVVELDQLEVSPMASAATSGCGSCRVPSRNLPQTLLPGDVCIPPAELGAVISRDGAEPTPLTEGELELRFASSIRIGAGGACACPTIPPAVPFSKLCPVEPPTPSHDVWWFSQNDEGEIAIVGAGFTKLVDGSEISLGESRLEQPRGALVGLGDQFLEFGSIDRGLRAQRIYSSQGVVIREEMTARGLASGTLERFEPRGVVRTANELLLFGKQRINGSTQVPRIARCEVGQDQLTCGAETVVECRRGSVSDRGMDCLDLGADARGLAGTTSGELYLKLSASDPWVCDESWLRIAGAPARFVEIDAVSIVGDHAFVCAEIEQGAVQDWAVLVADWSQVVSDGAGGIRAPVEFSIAAILSRGFADCRLWRDAARGTVWAMALPTLAVELDASGHELARYPSAGLEGQPFGDIGESLDRGLVAPDGSLVLVDRRERVFRQGPAGWERVHGPAVASAAPVLVETAEGAVELRGDGTVGRITPAGPDSGCGPVSSSTLAMPRVLEPGESLVLALVDSRSADRFLVFARTDSRAVARLIGLDGSREADVAIPEPDVVGAAELLPGVFLIATPTTIYALEGSEVREVPVAFDASLWREGRAPNEPGWVTVSGREGIGWVAGRSIAARVRAGPLSLVAEGIPLDELPGGVLAPEAVYRGLAAECGGTAVVSAYLKNSPRVAGNQEMIGLRLGCDTQHGRGFGVCEVPGFEFGIQSSPFGLRTDPPLVLYERSLSRFDMESCVGPIGVIAGSAKLGESLLLLLSSGQSILVR
ncbi:MAG: hypothetical protein HYV07_29120 [Deltaproteobacteria bacterium]|nr:hypothetical protein [Deltaproteobacteria bacterium]